MAYTMTTEQHLTYYNKEEKGAKEQRHVHVMRCNQSSVNEQTIGAQETFVCEIKKITIL